MAEARTILHSDLNGFYASVEIMLNPTLRDKAVAVCGSTEHRHGIVLAKSEQAKKAGVKTGMVNWQAKLLCPDLIICHPQYEEYVKYSKLTREIYQRFTDLVEPFGMDECWLDVTGCRHCGGDGYAIAETIRRTVREELGLTVSIGVSFNKIFAKLGSDMKKPDAVTPIGESDFREKVWPLPASELIYVGRSTTRKLAVYGIHTIGDIARASPEFLKRLLGVNGLSLWTSASGLDCSRVMHMDTNIPAKSIGHGITCVADLNNSEEVWKSSWNSPRTSDISSGFMICMPAASSSPSKTTN
jgi:DNA polymerase-4